MPDRVDQIRHCILAGSQRLNDGWRSYNNILGSLNNGMYIHEVIVHQEDIVHPINKDVRSQKVDIIWTRGKKKITASVDNLFISYLHEFI